MFEIFYITFIIVSLLFVTGYGISSLLFSQLFEEDLIWISPWIGTILITIILVYFSMAGIPVKSATPIIIGAASILFLYALFKRRISFQLSKEFILQIILTTGVFLVSLYPLLKLGYATTISLGNLDPLAYVNPADYLVNHSVFGNTFDRSLYPAHAALVDIINFSYRWGSVIIMSFFSSLLFLTSYKIYSIMIIIYFALTFPLLYILAKVISKVINEKQKLLIIFITFLTYGINGTLLYILYNMFFGQILFDGLFLLFIIFIGKYFYEYKSLTLKINRYDVFSGVILSGIITIYPDGFIMLYAPLVGTGVLSFILLKKLGTHIKIIKTILISIAINPFIFYVSVKWVYRLINVTTHDQKIGWEPIRYAFPHEFLGFYNLHYYQNLPTIIDIVLFAIFIVIFAAGYAKIKQKILFSMYTLLFLTFMFIFRFITPNFFVYHRTVMYAVSLFSVLSALGISLMLIRIKKKIILVGLLIVASAMSLRSAHRTIYQMDHHKRVVDRALISLEEVNRLDEVKSPIVTSDVFSPQYDIWVRLWREYFLHDKKLITLTNIQEHSSLINDDSFVLLEKSPIYMGSPAFPMTNVIWENNYYKLGKICRKDECLVKSSEDFSFIDFKNAPYQDGLLDSGWDTKEEGHRWVSSSEASLRLVKKDALPRSLILNARTIKEPQTVKIYVNEILLGQLKLKENYEIYTLPLMSAVGQKIYVIRFVFDHQYMPSKIGLNEDSRNLAADFQEIRIK